MAKSFGYSSNIAILADDFRSAVDNDAIEMQSFALDGEVVPGAPIGAVRFPAGGEAFRFVNKAGGFGDKDLSLRISRLLLSDSRGAVSK